MRLGLKKLSNQIRTYTWATTALCIGFSLSAQAEPILLELFTSTQCAACYSADKNVKKINESKDVFVLSYHVDYWDTKDQKDPFSTHNNMLRHNQYRAHFKDRMIYTPYAVIGGTQKLSSGDLWKMGLGKKEQKTDPYKSYMTIHGTKVKNQYQIEMHKPDGAQAKESQVLLAVYDPTFNKKPRFTVTNIVRNIQPLYDWSGDGKTYTVQLKKEQEQEKFLLILQEKASAKILSIKFL